MAYDSALANVDASGIGGRVWTGMTPTSTICPPDPCRCRSLQSYLPSGNGCLHGYNRFQRNACQPCLADRPGGLPFRNLAKARFLPRSGVSMSGHDFRRSHVHGRIRSVSCLPRMAMISTVPSCTLKKILSDPQTQRRYPGRIWSIDSNSVGLVAISSKYSKKRLKYLSAW